MQDAQAKESINSSTPPIKAHALLLWSLSLG
jgi:hypothetical protein